MRILTKIDIRSKIWGNWLIILFSADKKETSKMSTRINKYLSEVGFCSRRAADKLIQEGKVTINGEITEIGTKVEEGDQVEVNGQRIIKSIKHKAVPEADVGWL